MRGLPLSSTRMEAMAIIAAVVIAPLSPPLDIHTDSQSAKHMMHRAMAPTAASSGAVHIARCLPLAPPSELAAAALSAPTNVFWICDHSGDAGNETADRLAASAHNERSLGHPVDNSDATN